MEEKKKEVRKIPLKALIHLIGNSTEDYNRRFCFILGAGASREGGILTGVEMAKAWSNELHEIYTNNELKELMQELEISSIEPSSENYFGIYDLRFYQDYREGNAYFERELEKGTPSLGHYALAMMLAGKKHNLAITTNFDSLIEDALYIYTQKHPLVVNHESLSGFIDLNIDRPMIAKIHRGLYFEPFNRQKDTEGLAIGWQTTLRKIFMLYTPVFIGYAGGDRSLMSFLKDETIHFNGFYWCYWDQEEPSDDIKNLVMAKDGFLVPIEGFNQMMFMISRELQLENPEEQLREVSQLRIDRYNKQYEEFEERLRQKAEKDAVFEELVSETIKEIDNYNLAELNKAICKVNNTPTSVNYVELGNIYYRINKFPEAISAYDCAIKFNTKNKLAYANRGTLFFELKDYFRALKDYTEAIEIDSKDEVLYNRRGNTYSKFGDYFNAIADYTKVIELDPQNAEAYNNRGKAYYELEDYTKAMGDCTKAIELDPQNAKAYINRGAAYYELEEYTKAIEDCTKAIEDCTKVIELDPQNAEAYINRGDANYVLEEHTKAIEDYTKAIELDSQNSEAYNNRGAAYYGLEDYTKAIEEHTKAIESDPQNAEAYINRGEAYYELEEYTKAIEDYTKAIELAPQNASAYNNRGDVYYELEDYTKAIEEYTKAIESNPQNAEAYIKRGAAYFRLKEYTKTIEDYTKAIGLIPPNAYAYNSRGDAYFRLKEYKKAIEDYTKVLELDPQNVEAYYNRGDAYFRLKEYTKASEEYKIAKELDPKNAEAYMKCSIK